MKSNIGPGIRCAEGNHSAAVPGMLRLLAAFFLVFACSTAFSQKENKLIREGNKYYEQEKYKDAEMSYRKALEINNVSPQGQFNLGTATYQEKNYEEAAKLFGSAAQTKLDKNEQANALHNLGNSYLEAKQYDKSIQAYQNSLMKRPSDLDTKYNLEYAKAMLKKQQQQQQQKQNQDNKDNKDNKNKDKQNQDQQKQNQDQQKQDQQKQKQDQQKKISKEDADRMLEALKNDEKKTLAKLNKDKAKKAQAVIIEKDW
jgi:Ca-activated chloride channel homolog